MSSPPASLEYPFSAPPESGGVREAAPGVYWLRMPLPFILDHINLWLIQDGAGFAIVDCGVGDEATRRLWAGVFSGFMRDRPASQLIVTHFHPDHIGNAAWLSERFGLLPGIARAEYLTAHASADHGAGYTDAATLEFFRMHGLDEARRSALRTARVGGYRRSVPELPLSYRRLSAGETIRIGDHCWRLLGGEGHSPEHLLLYCEALGVLISGDMVLPRISTNVSVHAPQPEADPLRLFLESIRAYAALPEETLVLPSHGLPFRGLHPRIAALERHHAERLSDLQAACAEARCAAELMGTLFRRPLDGHQTWFAMGETLAHLNFLVQAGRLARVRGPEDLIRFVRPAA
jgi:glyoxylase-like metal-dependent hydrolase (beta-lactamase superfamily II)